MIFVALVNNVNDAEDEFSSSGAKCAEAGTEYFGNDLNVRRNGLRNVVSILSRSFILNLSDPKILLTKFW